jgi:hypothetical protein
MCVCVCVIWSDLKIKFVLEPNGDPIGPARVWLRNDNVPGLAMSRSFGDRVASQVGVISEPGMLNLMCFFNDDFRAF